MRVQTTRVQALNKKQDHTITFADLVVSQNQD